MTASPPIHEVADGTTGRTVLLCHPGLATDALNPSPEVTWARGITLLAVNADHGLHLTPAEAVRTGTTSDADQISRSAPGETGRADANHVSRSAPGETGRADANHVSRSAPGEAARTDANHVSHSAVAEAGRAGTASAAGPETDGRDQAQIVDGLAADLRKLATPPIGLVGWGTGGHLALALAARHPDLIDRLVLVATPSPPSSLGPDPADVAAKTLLLYGAKDPNAGPKDGKWYQQRLPNCRYEQVPGPGELRPATMWVRTLSHVAPHLRRSA